MVSVFVDNIAQPVEGALVNVSDGNNSINLITDASGRTDIIELETPNIEYTLEPQNAVKPFSTYNVSVYKDGLGLTTIIGVQVYANTISFQDAFFSTTGERTPTIITPPTIWESGAPKIVENVNAFSGGEKVLPRVVVPEYIIVHDGIPTDTYAPNYYVSFSDYIKNVACSEIYPTWPRETLKANVHAIVSFTLNRVYTEWYFSKGYNFTITSSTAYDQKYTYNRTIFDTISDVVDEIFMEYLKFPNRSFPFFAQYSDGINVVRDGWLSQWGSKTLGEQGYTALQIVRHYYGNTIELAIAEIVPNLPTSFPGFNLEEGACGEYVQLMQNALNKIRGSYPAMPLISNTNGIFDKETTEAVKKFQSIFNLPVTGIVNFATWYRISAVYVAVSDMLKGIFET
ncbi:MAG: peptidoglycan-binding protein [Bacilli bacterium]